MQQLEAALGGARIPRAAAEIGVDDPGERKLREVMAFGDDLRADEDIDVALRERTDHGLRLRGARERIARRDRDACIGEAGAEFLFDALDARAAGDQRTLLVALRTTLGDRDLERAMMADESLAVAVLDHPG